MSYHTYRLTLDENGQEDVRDFDDLDDATEEFERAVKRRVFSAQVDEITNDVIERLMTWGKR